MPPRFPDWSEMGDPQKLEYLHEWCRRLSEVVDLLRASNQTLNARVQDLEEKAERASRANPTIPFRQ